MLPTLTTNNTPNTSLSKAKAFCKRSLGHALAKQFADNQNIRFGQLGSLASTTPLSVMRGNDTLYPSPFSSHIMQVVFGCAEKQVVRVDTVTNIASMAHKQSVKYQAVAQLIRNAMRVNRLRLDPKASVSVQLDVAKKQPASIRTGSRINLSPKSGFHLGCDIIRVHFTSLLNRLVGVTPKDVSASLRLCYASIIPRLSVNCEVSL